MSLRVLPQSVSVLNLEYNVLCEGDYIFLSSIYLSFVLYVLVNPMYRIFCPLIHFSNLYITDTYMHTNTSFHYINTQMENVSKFNVVLNHNIAAMEIFVSNEQTDLD